MQPLAQNSFFRKIGAFLLLAAFLTASGTSSRAASISYKGGTGALSRKQSWNGNKTPVSTDIAVWNSTTVGTTNASLGANVTWLGIQIVNPGGAITFNTGNTLTLGASGIDMSAATVNFTLNCVVALAASQIWSVNGGRTL